MAEILIVDDDPEILAFLRIVLEREGHCVDSCADGKSARTMYDSKKYDLLVTDVVLPGKEGLDLILELERDYPGLKVIAMSGGDRIEPDYYLELATILGAQHTLAKPFTPAEFLTKVRGILHGQGSAPQAGFTEINRL
jgi:DNA-binding response OmpR family regulator